MRIKAFVLQGAFATKTGCRRQPQNVHFYHLYGEFPLDCWLYSVLQNVLVTMGAAARAPWERLVV